MKDESQSQLMKTGRRPIIYLVPLFIAAMTVGFLLELVLYESLRLSEIRLAISNFSSRWYHAQNSRKFVTLLENQDLLDHVFVTASESAPLVASAKPLEIWEQPTLLNLNNFTWISNNVNICSSVDNPKVKRLMPILVHTARNNFKERIALRKSIGSLPPYKNWIVRLVFLLGKADRGLNPHVNQEKFQDQEKQLQDEQNKYGDVVIGSFIDTYHNLTYKHLMGYKWILNFCSKASLVLKIDDDMFVDILTWLDWRTNDLQKEENEPDNRIPDLYCHTFGGTKPIRQEASKWYASKDDWPEENYPDYCSGWAYGITVNLIRKLYSVSNNIKFFWIDDVFATGALMQAAKEKYNLKLEVRHIWGNVTADANEYRQFCEHGSMDGKREFRAVAYIPRGEFFERDMMCMFNKTLHDSNYKFS